MASRLLCLATLIGLSTAAYVPFTCNFCTSSTTNTAASSLTAAMFPYFNFGGGMKGVKPAANCDNPALGGVPTTICSTSCFSAYVHVNNHGVPNSPDQVILVRGCADKALPGEKIYQKIGCCTTIKLNGQSGNTYFGNFTTCPCNTGMKCNAMTKTSLISGGSNVACTNPCPYVACPTPKTEMCSSFNGVSGYCGNFLNGPAQAPQKQMTVGTAKPVLITSTTTAAPTTTTPTMAPAPTTTTTMAPATTTTPAHPPPTSTTTTSNAPTSTTASSVATSTTTMGSTGSTTTGPSTVTQSTTTGPSTSSGSTTTGPPTTTTTVTTTKYTGSSTSPPTTSSTMSAMTTSSGKPTVTTTKPPTKKPPPTTTTVVTTTKGAADASAKLGLVLVAFFAAAYRLL